MKWQYDAHLADILATVRPLAPLELELEQALGGTLAEEITSPVPLPPFNNSAMDGYAVRAVDIAQVPVTLPVIDDVAAGSDELRAIGPGHTMRIMTGGPLPAGADAVVPVEWTDGGTVSVRSIVRSRSATPSGTRARTCPPARSCWRPAR